MTRIALVLAMLVAGEAGSAHAQRMLLYGPGGTGSMPYFTGSPAVTVASDAMWRSMSTAEFGTYDVLWVDGNNCSGGPALFQAFYDTQATWGPAVTGRIAMVTADPDLHAPGVPDAQRFIQNHQSWLSGLGATGSGGATGLYFATGCVYYVDMGPPQITVLEPTFGAPLRPVFLNDEPDRVLDPSHPLLAGINTVPQLAWGTFGHGGIDMAIPGGWNPLIGCPGRYCEIYRNRIMAAAVCGNGAIETGEVCDDGNTTSCDGCRGDCRATDVVGCNISGSCVADGTVNPSNSCEACRRMVDATRYTGRPAGTSCDDGAFCSVGDACNGSGGCVGSARDCSDGISCTTDSCDEGGDRCSSTVTAGCLIGGSCISDGAIDPGNVCRGCVASASRTDWSPRAAGTPCGDPSCMDGTFMPAPSCDGSGSCAPGGTMGCPGGVCADEFSCTGMCMDDTGCPLARFCATDGRCVMDLPPGETCDRPGMCAMGFCVDGFCCDDGCDGLCLACDLAGRQGTCSPHDRGSDPDADCADPRTCDGAGACFDPTPDAGPGSDGGPGTDGGRDAAMRDGGARLEAHGSGIACHAAGGPSGAWIVLLALVLVARRRRRV